MAKAIAWDIPEGPEWRVVTPKYAEWLLDRNNANRKVRDKHVTFLAQTMVDGTFVPTTDGIGIRSDGVITNGQHRLMAIVRSGVAQRLLIVPDMPAESYLTQDQNASARNAAETLGTTSWMIADVQMLLELTRVLGQKYTRQDMLDAMDWWAPVHEMIMNVTSHKTSKGFTSAPYRLGAGLRWAISTNQFDRNYIEGQLRALVYGDTPNMSRAAGNLYRRIVQGGFRSGTRDQKVDFMIMVFLALDPQRHGVETILRDRDAWAARITEIAKQTEDAYQAAPKGGHPYKYAQLPTLPRWNPNKKRGVTNDDNDAQFVSA